jgi:glycosyltransferase involved in cell wall biosynthesis
MPEISVIIPTFNRSAMVRRAISSVLVQDHPSFEVIVVDDGSIDDTRMWIPSGKKVKFLVHPANRGVSAARNTGIRYSSGRLVAFLDSDDYWLPGKLRRQADYFIEYSSAVACQTGERWIRQGRRVNPGRRHIKPSGDIFRRSLDLCLVSPSSVMLKRELFEDIGVFDERLPACEDYDLWLRITCRYPIHLVSEELTVREGGRVDQLSASFPGMDLFRIRSLVKVIGTCPLTHEQQGWALETLQRKSNVYADGCMKRGRTGEAGFFRALPERVLAATKGDGAVPSHVEIPLRFLRN